MMKKARITLAVTNISLAQPRTNPNNEKKTTNIQKTVEIGIIVLPQTPGSSASSVS